MSRPALRRYLATFLATVGLAACSGSDPGDPAPDTAAPAITLTVPSSAADDVSVVTTISVTFSEPMNTAATALALTPDAALLAPTWSNGDRTVTYRPATALAYGTAYTATIVGEDAAHNAVGSGAAFAFTTRAAPGVVFAPGDGASSVGSRAPVVLTFDEPVDPATLSVSVTDGTGPFPLSAPVWSAGNTVVTFSHDTPFQFAHGYTVALDWAKTATGDPCVPEVAAFETAPRPAVTSSDPAPRATGVPTSAVVTVRFNVPMDRTSVPLAFSGISCLAYAWNTPLDTAFTCVPGPGALAPNTTYTFRVSTAAASAAGDAISPEYVSSFTTVTVDVDPPSLVTTSPLSGSPDVLPGGGIAFTFSEPMHHADTQQAVTVRVTPEGGSQAVRSGTFGWNQAGTVLTFAPTTPFAKGDAVAWSIAASTGSDLAGLPLPPASGTFHVVKQRTQALPVVAAKSGHLVRTPLPAYSVASGSARVGDTAQNGVYRGYWTFDLNALSPAPVRINSATLAWTISAVAGLPTTGLGTLQVRSVDYGASLDASAADFDVPTDTFLNCGTVCLTLQRRFTLTPAVGSGTADVTGKVTGEDFRVASRGGRSQFQLAFSTATDVDAKDDYVTFATTTLGASAAPKLTVDYDYAW